MCLSDEGCKARSCGITKNEIGHSHVRLTTPHLVLRLIDCSLWTFVCLRQYVCNLFFWKQLGQSIRLELKYLGIDFEDFHYVEGPGVCTCEGYVVYVMVCTLSIHLLFI